MVLLLTENVKNNYIEYVLNIDHVLGRQIANNIEFICKLFQIFVS